ncbi:hypothetical protein E2C01_010271 [Portunus trituberculatus]|uniref:Uncharacterized protein n=1 Tax=Portunus trituberculatus TaxID=210409 RepID=A0A5B7D809_PORTR|nr:hypothetical protein [Portunus trituberculatus]
MNLAEAGWMEAPGGRAGGWEDGEGVRSPPSEGVRRGVSMAGGESSRSSKRSRLIFIILITAATAAAV